MVSKKLLLYSTLFSIVFAYTFSMPLFSQENNKQLENTDTKKKINTTQKKKNKHVGKYGLGIGIGFSFSFYPVISGIHERALRFSNAIQNFQESSLDDGSSYDSGNAYGPSLGFQFEYHVHKAKFLFFRVGFNIDFPFHIQSQKFSVSTKPLDGDPELGLDIAYRFQFEFKNVYKAIFPILIGFEHNVNKSGTGFYFGIGGYIGIYNLVYETKGARGTSCIQNLSPFRSIPVIEGQSPQDCGLNRNQLTGDAKKFLLPSNEPNTTTFRGTGFGATFLLGIKQKIIDSLYIFAEISINLGISSAKNIAISSAINKTQSNIESAFHSIRKEVEERHKEGGSLLSTQEKDKELIQVLDAFVGDTSTRNTLEAQYTMLSLSPGTIGNFYYTEPPSPAGTTLIDINYSWRIGVKYIF